MRKMHAEMATRIKGSLKKEKTQGSSINDVTGGRGQKFCDDTAKAFNAKKSDDVMGVQNCSKLCDVIYGRSLI